MKDITFWWLIFLSLYSFSTSGPPTSNMEALGLVIGTVGIVVCSAIAALGSWRP